MPEQKAEFPRTRRGWVFKNKGRVIGPPLSLGHFISGSRGIPARHLNPNKPEHKRQPLIYSPHTRGSKSMLSHCCLPPKQFPCCFLVYIQSKPSLDFLINPCYARPVGLVPSARLEITARFNAGAEGPTFVKAREASQPTSYPGQASGLSPLSCLKSRELDHLDRVQTANEQRQLTRALTSVAAV